MSRRWIKASAALLNPVACRDSLAGEPKIVTTGLLPVAPCPGRPGVEVFSIVSCNSSQGVLAVGLLHFLYS